MQWNKLDYVFAGSRQRVSPFPTYMSYEIMCNDMGRYVGATLRDVVMVCEGNLVNFFVEKESWTSTGPAIAREVQQNPTLFLALTKSHAKKAASFVRFVKAAAARVRTEISNTELFGLYEAFEKLYREQYAPYAPVWVMGDALPAVLYEIVLKYENDPIKASDILSILTQEPSAMVSLTERRDLFRLAVSMAKNNARASLIKKKIQAHADAYFWMTRDYEDPIMTYEDVAAKLQNILKQNPGEQLKELEESQETLMKKKKEYVASLGISRAEQKLFQAMRDGAHLKELRKKNVSEALYYFDRVLDAIGRLLFLSLRQVRFLRTEDVRAGLLESKDLTHEVNLRIDVSCWYSHDGTSTKVITGKEAAEWRDRYCAVKKDAEEFTGVPVSPGIAKGKVKIVMNPDECDKVEKGDVIVTVQVVPSFSTAIIKAAALVCDGGTGITSHPATLAREAGIPCVIQTRFAREVLKDGDMVEVDGYKGIVRVIR